MKASASAASAGTAPNLDGDCGRKGISYIDHHPACVPMMSVEVGRRYALREALLPAANIDDKERACAGGLPSVNVGFGLYALGESDGRSDASYREANIQIGRR